MGIFKNLLLLISIALPVGTLQAVTLQPGTAPPSSLCSTNWSVSGSTYTCTGNGRVTIPASGINEIMSSQPATIIANNGFSLGSALIGSTQNPINITSTYGSISLDNTQLYGAIQSSSGSLSISNSFVNGQVSTNSTLTTSSSTFNQSTYAQNGVTATNGVTFNEDVEANSAVLLTDSVVLGSVTSNSNPVTLDNTRVEGDVTAPTGTVTAANGSVVEGFVDAGSNNIEVTDSSLLGGGSANSGMTFSNSILAGDFSLTSNNTIDISSSDVLSGSLDAFRITIDNNSSIGSQQPIFINYSPSGGLNSGSPINAICTPENPRCSPAPSICESIWPQGSTDGYDTSNAFPAPPNPDYTSLPPDGVLQTGDYVVSGPITIGASRPDVAVTTTGTTTRVYIDGDLQLGSTGAPGQSPNVFLNYAGGSPGPAENLIVIVNGDLTIGQNVRASAYFFVNGNVDADTRAENVFLVHGALTATGELSPDFRAVTTITYQIPPGNLNSGGFCEAVIGPEQPIEPNLQLKLNDGPWAEATQPVIDSGQFSLDGRAFNGVDFSRQSPAIPTNPAGLGTCGYASFNASQRQYIEVPHSSNLSFNDSFTVGTWVRPNSLPSSGLMTILSKDTNYEFHLNPNGTVNWWWNNTSGGAIQFNSQHEVEVGEWNYVAIRYTPTEQSIFINGQKTTFTNTQGLRQNQLPLQIGSDQNVAGRYFNGDIDEVTVLEGALSDSEIAELSQRVSACQPEPAQCFPVYDFDASESLESRWIIRPAQHSLSNPRPRVSNNALRLTEALNDQSTLVSLRRVFPAAGNVVEIEFKLNAYGGSGADGIAVVLSDANQSPEPGGYGGSLGYAQRSGIPGFQGGWLGIGFDSFGNFAQATEGRVGGISAPRTQTTNMVSMRGASQTGYRFVPDGNSGQLSPGLRQAGSTRGPGHGYRIRIDSRSVSESFISVERDIGNGFEYIVGPIDIYDALDGQQPAVPENFRLSLTGSTGGSTDVHELEDIRVCAALSAPIDGGIDHLRLNHPGTLVSCYAAELELTACMDETCSAIASQDGEATLQTAPAAQWGGSSVIESDTNNARIFLSQGRANLQLSKPEGGTVDITPLSTTYPLATGGLDLKCFVGGVQTNCNILYNTAGFLFYEESQSSLALPAQISGAPFNSWLRAVQTNTETGACEARIEGSQIVELGYNCINPGQCQAGQSMTLASAEISNSGAGTVSQSTPLVFNNEGYAPLNSNIYTDAGEVMLYASATLEEEPREGSDIVEPSVTITGISQPFVVKPYELRVVNPALSSTNGSFVAAGEAFLLQVQALNTEGGVTPNFGLESQPAQPEANLEGLILPIDGISDPGLFSTGVLHRVISEDYGIVFETETAAWQEAGTIRVSPSLQANDYLGAGDIPNKTAADIGRFYPAYLELVQSELEDICLSGEPFTYLEQPGIWATYEVRAKAQNGSVTQNYTPYNDDTSHLALVEFVSATENIATSRVVAPDNINWELGVLEFQSGLDDISVSRHGDGLSPEGPFPETRLALEVADSVDPVAFASEARLSGELNLRYGRLVLNDVSGPEDEALRVTAQSEYWDGSRFVINVDDFCTRLESPDVSLESANEPDFDLNRVSVVSPISGDALLRRGLSRAEQSLELSPSNELVEIEYCYQAPPWLQHPWENDVSCTNSPSALAIFGQYRGNDRIIFWLERGL